MDYFFLPYNSLFPKLFEKEKSCLHQMLDKDAIIEHFGSTAVPGLGGKGVIDIYLLVSKSKIKNTSKILQSKGYIFKPNAGDKNRWFHQIDKKFRNKEYHYHIHLSFIGNKNFQECIAFRDYLRIHPKATKKYAKIKQVALKKLKNVTDKKELKRIYLETKGAVVQEIINEAKLSGKFG
jgi:GrpB-like predicted nucleotidyltransferase (UPF0157 family)